MSDEGIYVNGLAATPVRVKLMLAVRDEPGRIYYEPAAKAAYDASTGRKRTFEVKQLLDHEWIRVRRPDEPRHVKEWSETRVVYRLTDYGRKAIERGRQ